MKGGKTGRNAEAKYESLRCMSWNINGWKGGGEKNQYKKIRRVRGEATHYDVIILTETHLSDEKEEIDKFESYFKEYHLYHVHAKEDGGRRLGITMGIKKNKVEAKDIEVDRETDGEGGRWIRASVKGVIKEELHIWGIYAPVNARDRVTWMKKVGGAIAAKNGPRMIAGDYNFVMDTAVDKIRGNKRNGMQGKEVQRHWENAFGVVDIWRELHPRTIAATWEERGGNKSSRVKTRIDRVLISEDLCECMTEVEIEKTNTSDHNMITWTLETTRRRRRAAYDRLPVDMLENKEFQDTVKAIFEEERGGGLEGYETFKKRCVKLATKWKKKEKKRRRRSRDNLNKQIQLMRRIVEWVENARLHVESGKKIAKWKRGNQMLRDSHTNQWTGKKIHEITDLKELEIDAERELDRLLEEREDNNVKKIQLEKKIQMLHQVQDDDRPTKSFFKKIEARHTKEEIFALMEETINKDTGEKTATEKRDQKDLEKIASDFYKELWSKRRISRRTLTELIANIRRKINDAAKMDCDKEIKKEEVIAAVKQMRKGKSPGIDGIPVEFYQKFDYVMDWLHELYGEMLARGEMTQNMRTSVVKLLFKKKDRKDIGNYRPISLLCADYKIIAKVITERMKKVLKQVIDADQQGFIEGGDITGNLMLVKEIIEYCNEEEKEGCMIMMDFMKAYDRVDRGAMMETMRAMNFGERFLEMIEMLYAKSVAKVIVNGEMGEEFETCGGVRQGCPLSPYLFIVVLELMAIAMRESNEMEGIMLKEREQEAERKEEKENMEHCEENMEHCEEATTAAIKALETATQELEHCGDAEGTAAKFWKEVLAELKKTQAVGKAGRNDDAGDAGDEGSRSDQPEQTARDDNNHHHNHHNNHIDNHQDRISMFADDSSTFIRETKKIQTARQIIRQYEKATGARLHDGKTKILRLGKTRTQTMTNKSIGVDFEIMEDTDTEIYLGDVTGNEVTDEQRWDEPLKRLQKKGDRWNRADIGIYGRAIIANTILTAGLSHRAAVNTLSPSRRKKIQEAFRSFMWKGAEKKSRVKWEVLVQGEEEGGVGLKDPLCVLDAAKVRMIISLATRDRQPWMRWVERKMRKVGRRWGIEASALEATPSKEQLRELNEKCLVESTLKIWFDIGGSSKERRKQEGKEKEEKKEKENKQEMKIDQKRTKKEIGIADEGGWIPITAITTKQAYERLKSKRLKIGNYEPKKAHRYIRCIHKKLTADERDYWWRMTHELISTKHKECKWRRDDKGELVSPMCPVCREEREDVDHYNYGCRYIQEFMDRVAKKWGGGKEISKEEWCMEKEGMEEERKVVIAKARWIYHCERCKMDKRRRKRMNMEALMNRLAKRLAVIGMT